MSLTNDTKYTRYKIYRDMIAVDYFAIKVKRLTLNEHYFITILANRLLDAIGLCKIFMKIFR